MKRRLYLSLVVLMVVPSLAAAEGQGEMSVGLRTTDFAAGQESAKFGEYRDLSEGLFGSANLLYDTDEYALGASLENPGLDDQFYEIWGQRFGLGKGRAYYDELDHRLSLGALSPAEGIGTNHLIIPGNIPPVSTWAPFDYHVERKRSGAELTVDPQGKPFYLKASMEKQRHEGVIPRGLAHSSNNDEFAELPMPVDYTTDNLAVESGFRSKETTVVLTAGYSTFENSNDLLTAEFGSDLQEYSMPADNRSYNYGGRLVQRLPMKSVLALNGSYNRHISEANWRQFTSTPRPDEIPSADSDYDGDVEYTRTGAVLTSQWTNWFDTRLYYNSVDRNNRSEIITALDESDGPTNRLFEYDRRKTGAEMGLRLNKANKISGGYEFSHTNRTREDSDTTDDDLIFGQWKNSSLGWMTAKLRLEHLHRVSTVAYSAATLEDEGLIYQFFTPFDNASKDRSKAKLSLDFNLIKGLDLGVSYALVYDEYNATQLGLQDDKRHAFYLDINAQLPAKARLNTYAGYEITDTRFVSRSFDGGNDADPAEPPDPNDYNWSEKSTYDYFVVGGSLTLPLWAQFDLVLTADHQWVDGNIDFARAAAAGDPLESIASADDYRKTQLGAKGILRATDSLTVTLGYLFEKANLDEWKYINYTYTPDADNFLSGAGLDSDYEAHLIYVLTKYRF